MPFAFTPVTGLNDTAIYPTTPANEAAARQQVMDPLNQVRDYMNNSLTQKQSGTVTWIAPTLLNAWVNFGGASTTAGYYKDDLGIVRLRGLIKSGTALAGTGFFTLPTGYRPIGTVSSATVSNNGTSDIFAWASVDLSGNVAFQLGGNNWFRLDGITFRAEQ